MLLAALFGQLTRRIPNSDGGLYAYARHEFGDFAGYLTGWCYWIQCWAGNAAIVSAWVFYVDALFGIRPSGIGNWGIALVGLWIPALVNLAGQVIGIPTLAAGSPQGGGQAQGIGFAIPSNLARDIATQIIDTGHVTNSHRAAIGAEVATVLGPDGTAGGVGVVAVTNGGGAERAGLRAGDVITAVGGAQTTDTTALSQALAAAEPGDTVTVTISRDGQDRSVQVTLGELPGS